MLIIVYIGLWLILKISDQFGKLSYIQFVLPFLVVLLMFKTWQSLMNKRPVLKQTFNALYWVGRAFNKIVLSATESARSCLSLLSLLNIL
jgi:hypothetical protein